MGLSLGARASRFLRQRPAGRPRFWNPAGTPMWAECRMGVESWVYSNISLAADGGVGRKQKVGRKKPPGLAKLGSCFPWLELGFLPRFLLRDSSWAEMGSSRMLYFTLFVQDERGTKDHPGNVWGMKIF